MDLIEYKSIKENTCRHPWEQARLDILKTFVKKAQYKQIVADIGSGDAYFAKSLALYYPDSTIIAVDSNYDQDLISKLNKEKISNIFFFSDINIARKSAFPVADVVIMMDVLEHIKNPESFLKEFRDTWKLTADSFIIITVPAYQILFSKHDEKLGHFKRYKLQDLRTLLNASGFSVIYDGYFFSSLILLRFLQKLKDRFGNKKLNFENVSSWNGGKTSSALIKNILLIEFKISWHLSRLGIKLPGLTCFSICRPLP